MPTMERMPHYESSIQNSTISAILHILRHPSQIPSLLIEIASGTRAYYAAEDVVHLDREELIALVAWTRVMVWKMAGAVAFLGLLLVLGVWRNC